MMAQIDLLDVFRALANENRQEILFRVFSDKEAHSVGEIADRMGIAQSTASEHLTILRKAGILQSEKVDRQVLYTVNKQSVNEVLSMLQHWLTCC
ncbi:MAG: winged helix-turn-helix transcriptional regulator [Shimia sp.]|uniref:ArsR/SmtB family transcription factor n=1 Tax=Shimia sp. TaxID=1954381 RepID=UPI001B07BB1B|nr:metalloregulator ArsR/SmtB family transcription factor [Shimia sp.]MBO6898230.1 winged helix-turn-helix transcriptional regulator [Shimia sp.]